MKAFDKSLLQPKYWAIWFAYGLLRLLLLLPYIWIQSFGLWLGYKLAPLIKGRRKIVDVNVSLCYPEISGTKKEQLINDIMANNILGFFEIVYGWWGSDKVIARHSRLEGDELIKAAQDEGKGIILIGGHFSMMDISARVMTLHHDVDATYRKQNNPLFDYLVNKGRQPHFNDLIEKREMRKMIKNLRKGHIVWYATDQDFGRLHSVFAPFFGIPTATVTTIADLIRMTGAKPLFYSCVREGKGKDTLYVGKVSDPYQDQFSDNAIANATLLNKALEEHLKQHPSQYMWVHRRFKTRPNKEDKGFY